MKVKSAPQGKVSEELFCEPAISIIMPFEPKMTPKSELALQLKDAVDKVEKEVYKNYDPAIGDIVLQKLKKIIETLNYSTFKKSIAIYVSPLFEKVLYLDIPMGEKVQVNHSFRIKDLLHAKKSFQKYLVLILTANASKVYLADYPAFRKVKSNVPDHIAAFKRDLPQKVANFTDASQQSEILMDNFLRHTDDGLAFLLHAYPLPVFVMGSKKVLGHFKAITKNEKNISAFIPGSFDAAADNDLAKVLQPYIADWKKVKSEDLRMQIERAKDVNKLASGMREVWKMASQHRGRLLVIEEDFLPAEERSGGKHDGSPAAGSYNKYSYIKDIVDSTIEKVLENGGDVEFVERGVLQEYGGIALVKFF